MISKKNKRILLNVILIVAVFQAWSLGIAWRMNWEIMFADRREVVEKYLALPWNVNTIVPGPLFESTGGNTPLGTACFYKRYYAVEVLLEKGADPNFGDKRVYPPISETFSGVHPNDIDEAMEIAELLFKYGVDVNNMSTELSPLYAFGKMTGSFKTDENKEKYLQVVKYLVEKGAKVKGAELVYSGALGNHFELVKYLVEDVGMNGFFGRDGSAVSAATEVGSYEMVEYLLKQGFSATAKVPYGKTPMEYAEENNDEAMIELLKQYID